MSTHASFFKNVRWSYRRWSYREQLGESIKKDVKDKKISSDEGLNYLLIMNKYSDLHVMIKDLRWKAYSKGEKAYKIGILGANIVSFILYIAFAVYFSLNFKESIDMLPESKSTLFAPAIVGSLILLIVVPVILGYLLFYLLFCPFLQNAQPKTLESRFYAYLAKKGIPDRYKKDNAFLENPFCVLKFLLDIFIEYLPELIKEIEKTKEQKEEEDRLKEEEKNIPEPGAPQKEEGVPEPGAPKEQVEGRPNPNQPKEEEEGQVEGEGEYTNQ